MARSLVAATQKFKEASTWLADEDLPAIVMLETLAEQLDAQGPVPAMAAQYGLTYRQLLKKAPKVAEVASPLAAALEEAAK